MGRLDTKPIAWNNHGVSSPSHPSPASRTSPDTSSTRNGPTARRMDHTIADSRAEARCRAASTKASAGGRPALATGPHPSVFDGSCLVRSCPYASWQCEQSALSVEQRRPARSRTALAAQHVGPHRPAGPEQPAYCEVVPVHDGRRPVEPDDAGIHRAQQHEHAGPESRGRVVLRHDPSRQRDARQPEGESDEHRLCHSKPVLADHPTIGPRPHLLLQSDSRRLAPGNTTVSPGPRGIAPTSALSPAGSTGHSSRAQHRVGACAAREPSADRLVGRLLRTVGRDAPAAEEPGAGVHS